MELGESMAYVMVALGASCGAVVRFVVSEAVAARWGSGFPYGTLVVNVSGSLLIGVLLAALGERYVTDPAWRLLLVTGFLGGYTTFSTFSLEAVALLRQGAIGPALLYLGGSVALGVGAVVLGLLIGSWAHGLVGK